MIFPAIILPGQSYSNMISKTLLIDTCQIVLDTSIIAPSTVIVSPHLPFTIVGSTINFNCDSIHMYAGKPFEIRYRTLDIDLRTPQFFLDTMYLKQKETAVYIGYDYSPYKKSTSSALIDRSNMNYNGSISRGFSVGNSQNLLLNSNLNLQLNGDLGNGIQVAAAISDDNIPIQADGNTRLLQEFDRVFIQVKKDKTSVIAGDFDLFSQPSHFMRYYKKLQGLRLDHQVPTSETGTLTTSANMAVSRGKFARQFLQIQEGNQGPYKLQGNNGERFLIVLQGSERVYLDGNLLIRGQDYDYIIDYNNAEITFTQQRIISRELRIIVEFEYTDQNYLRSLYALQSRYETDKVTLAFDFYNEQDSRNATGQIELDSTDISILSNASNDPASLFRSGIRNPPDMDQVSLASILYRKEYNPESGDTILIYHPGQNADLVMATFSEVGMGNGDYIIDTKAGANGRVYKYAGKGQGAYLPIIQLIPPEKRQMMSVSAEVRPSNHSTIRSELAMSHFDDNRFSQEDNQNNQGMAANFHYQYTIPKEKEVTWRPVFETGYEYVHRDFRSLNPFRNQEFARDWNIDFLPPSDEHIAYGAFGIQHKQNFRANHRVTSYSRSDQYKGLKNEGFANFQSELTRISFNGSLLSTSGLAENTFFFRPTFDFRQQVPMLDNWAVRFRYFAENNERRDAESDEILPASFAFEEYYVYLESKENERKQFSFFGKHRIDRLPVNNHLEKATNIFEAGMQGRLESESNQLRWNLSYRKFEVNSSELVQDENTSTLLGRIDYGFEALGGMIQSSTSVNFGSGQEAKREFQFIRVEKGQGNYIYLGDLNQDGEDQINEYELAIFSDEADFIRVNVFNNEFIRTENKGINQSLRIMPERWIKDRNTPLKRIARKFSLTSVLRMDKKNSFDSGRGSIFNFSQADSNLVTYNALINNTLFFNRGNPTFDVQTGHRRSNNRFVQITGFEDRRDERVFVRGRINPKKYIDMLVNIERGNQFYKSEFIDSRDLDLNLWILAPSLVYRPSNKWRLTGKYSFETRNQQINDTEKAVNHALTFETTYREAVTSDLRFSFSLVNVQYDGDISAPVAYTILSGLNDGNNYLWSVNYTRRLAGNVDFNISYDGRKTGNNRTVHIARAQIRANF